MKRERTISIGENEGLNGRKMSFKEFCNYNTDDESSIISGGDHMKEKIEMKEQEQIKSDASFYDRCWQYIQKIEGGIYSYSTVYSAIKEYQDDEKLSEYIKNNIFATNLNNDFHEKTEEELKNIAIKLFAAVASARYTIQEALDEQFIISETYKSLSDVVGIDLTGEVFTFLNTYGE